MTKEGGRWQQNWLGWFLRERVKAKMEKEERKYRKNKEKQGTGLLATGTKSIVKTSSFIFSLHF